MKINTKIFSLSLSLQNRGNSQHARVKMFPDELDIGCVPFGIPCKRFILIVNPFMIPIAVQFTVGEDGDEIPLVLNVNDADGLPVITVKDYISAMIAMAEEELDPYAVEEPTVQLVSRSDSLLSYRSVSTEESTCSSYFEEEILGEQGNFISLYNTLNKVLYHLLPSSRENTRFRIYHYKEVRRSTSFRAERGRRVCCQCDFRCAT